MEMFLFCRFTIGIIAIMIRFYILSIPRVKRVVPKNVNLDGKPSKEMNVLIPVPNAHGKGRQILKCIVVCIDE